LPSRFFWVARHPTHPLVPLHYHLPYHGLYAYAYLLHTARCWLFTTHTHGCYGTIFLPGLPRLPCRVHVTYTFSLVLRLPFTHSSLQVLDLAFCLWLRFWLPLVIHTHATRLHAYRTQHCRCHWVAFITRLYHGSFWLAHITTPFAVPYLRVGSATVAYLTVPTLLRLRYHTRSCRTFTGYVYLPTDVPLRFWLRSLRSQRCIHGLLPVYSSTTFTVTVGFTLRCTYVLALPRHTTRLLYRLLHATATAYLRSRFVRGWFTLRLRLPHHVRTHVTRCRLTQLRSGCCYGYCCARYVTRPFAHTFPYAFTGFLPLRLVPHAFLVVRAFAGSLRFYALPTPFAATRLPHTVVPAHLAHIRFYGLRLPANRFPHTCTYALYAHTTRLPLPVTVHYYWFKTPHAYTVHGLRAHGYTHYLLCRSGCSRLLPLRCGSYTVWLLPHHIPVLGLLVYTHTYYTVGYAVAFYRCSSRTVLRAAHTLQVRLPLRTHLWVACTFVYTHTAHHVCICGYGLSTRYIYAACLRCRSCRVCLVYFDIPSLPRVLVGYYAHFVGSRIYRSSAAYRVWFVTVYVRSFGYICSCTVTTTLRYYTTHIRFHTFHTTVVRTHVWFALRG